MSKDKSPATDGPSQGQQHPTSPPTPGSAESWRLVEDEAEKLAPGEVVSPRVDLQDTAETALTVVDDLSDDAALAARIAAIAATGEVSADLISKTQRYAGAAWYARHRQLLAEAAQSMVVVPESLVTKGNEIFERMLKLAQYHFADHATEGAIVATINAAPGHRRLANNLITLSELYGRNRDAVKTDPKNYQPTDERDARKTAAEIIKALSVSEDSDAELWKGRCARVWTLLSRTYGELQSLGRWMLRATPELAAERFPSLISEARSPAPRRPEAPAPTPPVDGAAPVVVTPAVTKPSPRKRRTR
ncbi:MAG: hypothetical protein U0326_11980 [Polyangiales bacterium]